MIEPIALGALVGLGYLAFSALNNHMELDNTTTSYRPLTDEERANEFECWKKISRSHRSKIVMTPDNREWLLSRSEFVRNPYRIGRLVGLYFNKKVVEQ